MSANIRFGSDGHKTLFCRMLIDSFTQFEPSSVAWPVLDEAARRRLVELPIWDIAVATEDKAKRRVAAYAALLHDPLLRQATALNAFEEGRHHRLLAGLAVAYGIALAEPPAARVARDDAAPPVASARRRRRAEWDFMVVGFSECIDSFFAFGLFAAARQSGFFPAALVNLFEPVMQEECRHILYFINWAAWHRRNLAWWRRPIFAARVLGVWAFLVWERLRTARDVGANNNFTVDGSVALGVAPDARALIDLCLAENERRFAAYDRRLLRPRLVPRIARLARSVLGIMTASPLPSGQRT